jgi:hypothetical protein
MGNQAVQRQLLKILTYTTQAQLGQLKHTLNIELLQVVKRLSVFVLAQQSKSIIVLL